MTLHSTYVSFIKDRTIMLSMPILQQKPWGKSVLVYQFVSGLLSQLKLIQKLLARKVVWNINQTKQNPKRLKAHELGKASKPSKAIPDLSINITQAPTTEPRPHRNVECPNRVCYGHIAHYRWVSRHQMKREGYITDPLRKQQLAIVASQLPFIEVAD